MLVEHDCNMGHSTPLDAKELRYMIARRIEQSQHNVKPSGPEMPAWPGIEPTKAPTEPGPLLS